MCHYTYWGYDGCSHEYPSMENRWTLCPLSQNVAPRDCPFAAYTRHKIGTPFCESCLDEVPPNHPPVTHIILDFDNLRRAMELSVSQAACIRFTREYRAGLRRVRESSFVSGPNNNFYNDIWALYHSFHQRAIHEMSAFWTNFHSPPADIGYGASGPGITFPSQPPSIPPPYHVTSPGPVSFSPGYYDVSPGPSHNMAGMDSTVMAGVDYAATDVNSTSAGIESASPRSDTTIAGTGSPSRGRDSPSPGFGSPSHEPGFGSASAG